MSETALEIRGLSAGYGSFRALFDVGLTLAPGETIALIGANGAGKSTLLKSIVGMLPVAPHMIRHNGEAIGGLATNRIVARGITLVPEGRRLFADLTVEENLIIGGQVGRKGDWRLDSVYELFPRMQQRRRHPVTLLSGGEQQMVAIARALMSNPRILLLDEVSLGLAPVIVEQIYQALLRIIRSGMAAIVVEQDIGRALAASQRFLCMREGRVVLDGQSRDANRHAIAHAYFGAVS